MGWRLPSHRAPAFGVLFQVFEMGASRFVFLPGAETPGFACPGHDKKRFFSKRESKTCPHLEGFGKGIHISDCSGVYGTIPACFWAQGGVAKMPGFFRGACLGTRISRGLAGKEQIVWDVFLEPCKS